MCFSVSVPAKNKITDLLFGTYKISDYQEFFHVSGFTHPLLPVLLADHTVRPMEWGLIPEWIKDADAAKDIREKTLNARAETIFDLPSYKAGAIARRCIIFVDGFYEWQEVAGKKQPYYIYTGQPMAFAGICASWTDRSTGEVKDTCTIITTAAIGIMAKIHNTKKRMPVILPQNQWDTWLDKTAPRQTIESLLLPLETTALKAHPISKLITSRTQDTNVPEVQQRNDQ